MKSEPFSAAALPPFAVDERACTVVYDFMTRRLGLKGAELMLYARIFGFGQTGCVWFESKCAAGAHLGVSEHAVFDALRKLKEKGLVEEAPLRDALPCGQVPPGARKAYRPAPGPLAEIGVLPAEPEEGRQGVKVVRAAALAPAPKRRRKTL